MSRYDHSRAWENPDPLPYDYYNPGPGEIDYPEPDIEPPYQGEDLLASEAECNGRAADEFYGRY